MKLIAHRGNWNGRNEKRENHPAHIAEALVRGYDCEIDVWWYRDRFYLGHDEPVYPVSLDFLSEENLWCHAKTVKAMEMLIQLPHINAFWHEEDTIAVTTHNYMWTTRKNAEGLGTIFMQLEEPLSLENPFNIGGICSDNLTQYHQ